MYKTYWLISQDKTKTYVGFSERLEDRIREHKDKKVFTTKNFGAFRVFVLEEVAEDIPLAREREKYWKSSAGRKKLKQFYSKI